MVSFLDGVLLKVETTLREKFLDMTVSRESLQKAEAVLEEHHVETWEEEYDSSIVEGIDSKDFEGFTETFVENIGFLSKSAKKTVKGKLAVMKYGRGTNAAVDKVVLHDDNWKSLYGFLVAKKDSDNTITVGYCFFSLKFKIDRDMAETFSHLVTLSRSLIWRKKGRLRQTDIKAIKEVFCEHCFLLKLEKHKIIPKVKYVD